MSAAKALPVFLIFVFAAAAAADFEVPALTGPVVDRAGMVDAGDEAAVAGLLFDLKDRTGTQITVLTVQDLGGLTVEEASIRIVDAWQLGARETDTGILLLVAAKERKIRIEVGQGLEGVLPDAFAKRIVDEMSVLFRAGRPSEGILLGVVRIIERTNPDFQVEPSLQQAGAGRSASGQDPGSALFILFIFLLLILLQYQLGGRRMRAERRGVFSGGALPGRSWGSSSGGRSWSGGGGGFSGGGASGGW